MDTRPSSKPQENCAFHSPKFSSGLFSVVKPGCLQIVDTSVVGAAVVAGVGVVVGGSVGGTEVEASSLEMQVAVHTAPSPPLLRLFDRNSTLRVRPFTVTSGELSSQNFSFPIFMKSLPLLQLEFLAVRVNAEQEKFSLHLLFFPRLNLTTHLTFLPYVSVSWVEKSTDS